MQASHLCHWNSGIASELVQNNWVPSATRTSPDEPATSDDKYAGVLLSDLARQPTDSDPVPHCGAACAMI